MSTTTTAVCAEQVSSGLNKISAYFFIALDTEAAAALVTSLFFIYIFYKISDIDFYFDNEVVFNRNIVHDCTCK